MVSKSPAQIENLPLQGLYMTFLCSSLGLAAGVGPLQLRLYDISQQPLISNVASQYICNRHLGMQTSGVSAARVNLSGSPVGKNKFSRLPGSSREAIFRKHPDADVGNTCSSFSRRVWEEGKGGGVNVGTKDCFRFVA